MQDSCSTPTSRFITHIPLLLSILLIAFDIISFIASYTFAYTALETVNIQLLNNTSSLNISAAPQSIIFQNFFLVLGAVTTVILWSKGLYTNRTPYWSQIQFITKTVAFIAVVHILLSFALHIHVPIALILLSWALAYLLLVTLRAIAFKGATLIPSWSIPAVIISDNPTAEDLIYAFASDICTGYHVTTIFLRQPDDNTDFDASILPPSQQGAKVCYGQEDHEAFIRENPQYFYIISLDTFRDTARESIIRTLNENNTPYAIVPTLNRANMYKMEPKYFFGHDVVMLYVGNSAPQIFEISLTRILKRCMDIVVSGTALLILLPLLVTITAMLKIEGQKGSPFYGGRRIGKNGAFFNCWKFRSMEPDSDHLLHAYLDSSPEIKSNWEKYRKLPNDPRITTKTARLIRKTSLDELPQLWNIFVGDMSLVGPRPILEDETHYFEGDTLKEYMSIRPGLTGLWQVSGRNKTSFKRRVYWDSWYVRNWSLWGDIVILIKTPLVLLSRKGAS